MWCGLRGRSIGACTIQHSLLAEHTHRNTLTGYSKAMQNTRHHIHRSCHRTHRPMLAWFLAPGSPAVFGANTRGPLEEEANTNPLESPSHSLGDSGYEATDLTPGRRQLHPHQLAASNPDHVLHACTLLSRPNEARRVSPHPMP